MYISKDEIKYSNGNLSTIFLRTEHFKLAYLSDLLTYRRITFFSVFIERDLCVSDLNYIYKI